MVARKRKETEDYKEYKENLKEEAELLKYYLKGRIWWQSFHRGQFIRRSYSKNTEKSENMRDEE